MALSRPCPTCDHAIAPDQESGCLTCPACSEPIWLASFGSEWIVASTTQLEDRFGFDSRDFSHDETMELLRAWHSQNVREPWHIFDSLDAAPDDRDDPPHWDANPYHPPRSAPRKTDPSSETFIFRARVFCDEQTLRWATRNFGVQSDLAGLAFFGFLLAAGLFVALLSDTIESLWSLIQPGWAGWICWVVVGWFAWRRLPGFVMSPYVRLLFRRCQAEPLFEGDHFSVVLRQRTMTVSSQTMVASWPLRQVRSLHNEDHLVVLRVTPKRLLYLTSAAESIPEDFASFRRGIKKRLRRYWREQFFNFEIY